MVGGAGASEAAAAGGPAVPVLVVTAGPLRGTRVPLQRQVVLGRGALADLDLADTAVSRRHALIFAGGPGWQVTDLQSGNGTFLNGRAVTGATGLTHGDELRLGGTRLEYRDAPAAAAWQDAAEAAAQAAAFLRSDAMSASMAIPLAPSPAATSFDFGAESELHLLRRRLDLVGAVAEVMSRATALDELLGAVLRLVMRALPQADRACVAMLDEASGDLRARVALDRSGAAERMPLSQKVLRSAVALRQAVLVADTRLTADFPGSETVGRLGLRSFMCLPLVVGSQVFGALQVDTGVEGQPFHVEDLHALAGVAPSIALAIANATLHGRLLAHELEMRDLELAQRVQQQFLPQEPPSVPGYTFAFRCTPALAVGGDFFDFLPLESGRLGVAVGDVAGKGISAALLMARVMSDLRFVAGQGLGAAAAVVRLGRLLADATREAMFATLLYLEITPGSGEIELANAGHPRPLLRLEDGTVRELELPSGLPAGVQPNAAYRSHREELQRGAALLIYTDGVTEAVAASGERFGEERLREILAGAAGDPGAIVAAVVAAVDAWQLGCPPADDLTVVCLLRT
jgi:sigma-B regulation protein RsbU (phosphoserine phosphatase)